MQITVRKGAAVTDKHSIFLMVPQDRRCMTLHGQTAAGSTVFEFECHTACAVSHFIE